MKQHITLQQWDELSKEEKQVLWDSGFQKDWKINIGQMIEFLGDDWRDAISAVKPHGMILARKLCDELWEAVKYKLNQGGLK